MSEGEPLHPLSQENLEYLGFFLGMAGVADQYIVTGTAGDRFDGIEGVEEQGVSNPAMMTPSVAVRRVTSPRANVLEIRYTKYIIEPAPCQQ